MTIRRLAVLSLLALAPLSAAAEENVRYVTEGGKTYREVRRVVQEPVTRTETINRKETVYRQRVVTKMEDRVQTYWTPITEYRWEAQDLNWWNPFAGPKFAWRWVPRTRWEMKTQKTQVPVTRAEVVPVERTVQEKVRTLTFEPKERVERVVVAPQPGKRVATRPPASTTRPPAARYGGIERLDGDPTDGDVETRWR